ncbi:glycosyltransferase family 61 protein [Roseobacter sp. YSTF-M11]|uniref:Glycosyltransferase family 61 protein n=1 Tax=Roseobacter insulae TaxID=2859783 RepID=A0A9X1G065_9RHOB|nr:glycosyltransferase family 61 protein [Roseobacter insulae]MBW4710801.1 glycosyltransferase family 61 protein [Roseobacter insulae]
MKQVLRKMVPTLALVVPRLWQKLGLRRAFFAWFERKDCSLGRTGGTGQETSGLMHEELFTPDHPIHKPAGPDAQAYADYLRMTVAEKATRVTGTLWTQDARLSYPTAVHTTAQGIVLDNYPSKSVLHNPKYALPQAVVGLRKPVQRHASGFLMQTSWAHNFYHWTIDMIPRLETFLTDPTLRGTPIVMSERAPKFARKSLDLIAPNRPVLWLPDGVHAFETLAIPANLSTYAVVSAHAMKFLKDRYLPALRRDLKGFTPPGRRVYVSRADAAVRRIHNEPQIEAELKEMGFVSVVMSDFSIAEQAEIFAQAESIVCAHGAALANLAFCQPDTRVLEIFQQGHRSRAYYSISGLLGLRYGFVLGQPVGNDIHVDPPVLRDVLAQMDLC